MGKKTVNSSVNIRLKTGYSVLGIRAAGFVGIHVNNCNNYYDPTHKRASTFVGKNGIFHCGKKDRTYQPASLFANTLQRRKRVKKSHTYNHIYGLSLTGLWFFMVYGPWGRPDMAYFFFTNDILKRKPIPVFESGNHGMVAHDFTYIDDIVKGCLGALDTTEKSTGSGGKKKGDAQFRIFNLGNTSPVPVSDLVSILEKLLKVKSKRRVMKLPRNGDVPFTHANISLAQREFGFQRRIFKRG
ncbi:putative UDP-glucuronate 4-epimerase [Helianthus annuus]|nr:putative UDP-glucuronate 4-epimerase [Helianthus annuus]